MQKDKNETKGLFRLWRYRNNVAVRSKRNKEDVGIIYLRIALKRCTVHWKQNGKIYIQLSYGKIKFCRNSSVCSKVQPQDDLCFFCSGIRAKTCLCPVKIAQPILLACSIIPIICILQEIKKSIVNLWKLRVNFKNKSFTKIDYPTLFSFKTIW